MTRVRYLCPAMHGPPGTVYHWKPSPRLRAEGWTNLKLGTDFDEALARATERNLAALRSTKGLAATRRRLKRLEQHQLWVERQIISLRERIAAGKAAKGKVYFVAALKGPIKIGWALDPARRLAALQISSERQLRILAVVDGDQSLEREYHERFADYRIRGEWFAPASAILEEIKALRVWRRTATASEIASHGATA